LALIWCNETVAVIADVALAGISGITLLTVCNLACCTTCHAVIGHQRRSLHRRKQFYLLFYYLAKPHF